MNAYDLTSELKQLVEMLDANIAHRIWLIKHKPSYLLLIRCDRLRDEVLESACTAL
jgi:hypothetical protein